MIRMDMTYIIIKTIYLIAILTNHNRDNVTMIHTHLITMDPLVIYNFENKYPQADLNNIYFILINPLNASKSCFLAIKLSILNF